MGDMLGASTGGLADLAARLGATATAIGACQTGTRQVCDQLVESVRTAATTALSRIHAEMTDLRSEVAASSAASEGAAWTGANRETFVGAHQSFDASMRAAEAATADAFADFHSAVDGVAAALEQYVGELSTSMAGAVDSVEGMSGAVRGQLEALETAMNTGMSVG